MWIKKISDSNRYRNKRNENNNRQNYNIVFEICGAYGYL